MIIHSPSHSRQPELKDLFWILQFIPTFPPLSKSGAENTRFSAPRAPSFSLPTNATPLRSPRPVTTGWRPKALLGLLQEFPMCDSLPSPPSQTELAGGQATPGWDGGTEPSTQWLPALWGPHQLLSLGPCLHDEPSQHLSFAERSPAQHLLGLSGASQAQLLLLPALI